MGQWSANNPARATAVWDKLLGFYGDSLLRKFDATPPAEWVEAIGSLTDAQIARGMRRILFGSGAKGVPSLPEFMRLCRAIGDGDFDEGPKQTLALPNSAAFSGDGWDISGNLRLMKHILTICAADSKALGEVWPCEEVRDPNTNKFIRMQSRASTQQSMSTGILVGYKKAWSQDMREHVDLETGETGRPPKAYQDSTWLDCMDRAMAEVREALAQ